MRRSYLVCYDVRDPKRLRKVHRVMKAYGEAWQYSVFWCTLWAVDRERMEADDAVCGSWSGWGGRARGRRARESWPSGDPARAAGAPGPFIPSG